MREGSLARADCLLCKARRAASWRRARDGGTLRGGGGGGGSAGGVDVSVLGVVAVVVEEDEM